MSKSLGNFFTVRDLLDQGIPGEVIRFVFLSTHYGKPMDWTAEKAEQAEKTLRKWRDLTAGIEAGSVYEPMVALLADDLNTAGAIGELHQLAAAGDVTTLLASAQLLGLLTPELGEWVEERALDGAAMSRLLEIEKWIGNARLQAQETKDFSAIDRYKSLLTAAGIEVRMTREGVTLVPTDSADADAVWAIERDREAEV